MVSSAAVLLFCGEVFDLVDDVLILALGLEVEERIPRWLQ